MKKILFTGCLFTLACFTTSAQTALKIKLVPLAADLPSPPASLQEAYKLANNNGSINSKQDVYNHAQQQIDEVIAKIEAAAPKETAGNNDVLAHEAEDVKNLSIELSTSQQNMETKYLHPLSHPDNSGHDALDKKEAAALKALPIITMGEYTGVDPAKEQQIHDRYFNEHMKEAKAMLEKNRQLWAQCKSDFLAGLARFDTKLAAIDWGGKLQNPLLRPGIAGMQKSWLEMAHKMLACEHIMTYNAATWYAAYLDKPATKKQWKDITMA